VWVSSVSIGGVELELEDVLADVVIRHGRASYDEPPTASTVQLRLRGVDRELSGSFTVGVPLVVSTADVPIGTPGAPRLSDAGLGGGLVAGAYAYAVSYQTATGERLAGPASAPLLVAEGGTIRVANITTSPSDKVIGRNLYQSLNGGPLQKITHQGVVDYLANNTVTEITIGNVGGALGDPPPTIAAPDPDARFTGLVTDAALDDDELTVIGAGPLSTLSRYTIGAAPWPAERWHLRVLRAFEEAGVPELVALEFESDWDPELAARGTVDEPPDPVTLLDYLTLLADDLGAAIVDTPDGHVLIQELSARAQTATLTWETTPPAIAWEDGACTWEEATSVGALDPSYPVRDALVVDPADVLYVPAWEQTLDLENETTLGYGDQLAVTVDEPASIALYGPSAGSLSTQLAQLEDATTRAQERVGRLAFPRWIITAAHLLRGYPELAIGQPVELSDFPPSSPFTAWRPILEGWTDTIDGDLWTTDLALSDPLLSGVVLLWMTTPPELAWTGVDPACDWKDATTLDALTPARRPRRRPKEAVHA
jgi:hypothetical protein